MLTIFQLLKTQTKIDQISIIKIFTEKIVLVVAQATQRMFETLNQKSEIFTNQLSKKFNIEIEEILIGPENK
jgi:hypothetical protein